MATLDGGQISAIDDRIADWVFRNPVPGASVVLVHDDGELYAEGFGTRNVDTNEPATPETLFGMGSITKSVTALAVCQLADDGSLSLSDPVDEYVDDLADVPGGPITVEELLTHTSGIPSTGFGMTTQTLRGYPGGVVDAKDRRRLFRAKGDLRVTDEERFYYNNAGYGVLGSVVEAVDGRRFATYVDEEVLAPLGMDRTGFGDDAVAATENAATNYFPGDPPEAAPSPHHELEYANGGLVAPPRELGRYLRAMMSDGAVDEDRVCGPETVADLQRGRVTGWTRLDGAEQRYGYGWNRVPFDDTEVVGHAGGNPVMSAFAGFLPDEDLGIVLACNTRPSPGPRRLALEVLAMATGRDRTVVPAYALEQKAAAVTGTYTDFRERMTVTVEREEGGLTLTQTGAYFEGEAELTVVPASLAPDEYRFYTVEGTGTRFDVDFDVDGERPVMNFERVRLRRTSPEP